MAVKVVERIRKNSWLFLQRSINEMNINDLQEDQGLSEESAVISSMFIQMSLELALIASLIKLDGISAVVNKSLSSLDESSLERSFNNNELITISFNKLKSLAIKKGVLSDEDHICLIEDFQKTRNKVVHLNYKFSDGDLYDLKYDLVYFLVHVLLPIISDNCESISEAISSNIDEKSFKRLIQFGPYKDEMNSLASSKSINVYRCLHCGNDSLGEDDNGDEYCYSCGSSFEGVGFIDCGYCGSNRSLAFDENNIVFQHEQTIKGLCLSCGKDDLIYLCKDCGIYYPLEAGIGASGCYPDFCNWLSQ